MTLQSTYQDEWMALNPEVHAEAEFREILNDFGSPLEILREAISNAIDASATYIRISFDVKEIDGNDRLIIFMEDNGTGMSRDIIARDFWGLGFSLSRERKHGIRNSTTIGEKGHGTTIFLNSEQVTVRTQTNEGAFESICERPLSALSRGELHQPLLREIQSFRTSTGTEITVIGYNDNERAKFRQEVVKDYLLWFTKIGSVELKFGIDRLENFRVYLKSLDYDEFEEITFGHVFPDARPDINVLFDEYGENAADWYVKHYKLEGRLPKHPEVSYQVFVSVEGDGIKRDYNPMIRDRIRSDTGRYRVSDRYGLWLCKDYIPVMRVNEWLVGFGSGSNAFTILHGFINCQSLKLTANRGTIANTDPQILEDLQQTIGGIIDQIDEELTSEGLYTLRGWQREQQTLAKEKAEWDRRIRSLDKRQIAQLSTYP